MQNRCMGFWGYLVSNNSWKTSFIALHIRVNAKKINWSAIKKITIKKITFIRFKGLNNKVLVS